jgi:hypothetical protein
VAPRIPPGDPGPARLSDPPDVRKGVLTLLDRPDILPPIVGPDRVAYLIAVPFG